MEIITEEQCAQVVKTWERKCNKSGLVVKTYKVQPIDGKNRGHLGEYFSLTVQVEGQDEISDLHFFVKRSLSAPNRADFVRLVTRKEIDFYKFLNEAKVKNFSVDDTFAPRVYFLSDSLIVMDDLCKSGFFSCAHKMLNEEHMLVAFKCLAKLHVLSINQQRTNLKNERFLKEGMFTMDDSYSSGKYMKNLVEGICIFLKSKGRPIEMCEKFRVHVRNMIDDFDRPNDEDAPLVICHGDLWINNLLFSYDENGRPIECKLVDYQLTRLAPPAHDVTTLITHNTAECVPHNQLTDYFDLYYECLRHEIDPDHQLFSKVDFVKSCRKYLKVSQITKVLYAGFSAATLKRSSEKKPLDVVMQEDDFSFIVKMCETNVDINEQFEQNLCQLDALLMGDNWITKNHIEKLLKNILTTRFHLVYYFLNANKLRVQVLVNEEPLKLLFEVKRPTNEERKFYQQQGPQGVYEKYRNLSCVQKCHYADDQVMILEALQDHETINCRKPFTLDEVKMCLDSLAEFHAQGFLLKHSTIIANEQDVQYEKLKPLLSSYNLTVTAQQIREVYRNVTRLEETLLHGAFNNFNIRLDDYGESCKLTNFSHVKRGNPAEEVMSFLCYVTTRSFRFFNAEEMLVYYFDELLGASNGELPFTLEQFLDSCESLKTVSLINALIYHQYALIEEKNGQGTFRWPDTDMVRETYKTDVVYREKLDELMREFVELFP